MIENVSTQLTVFYCFAHCLLPGRAFASLYVLLFLEKEAEIGGRVLACPQRIQPVTGKWAIAYFNIVKFYLSTDLGKIRIKIGKNLETVM